MFYLINENGKITEFSNKKFNNKCLFTNKKLIHKYNGEIVFEEDLMKCSPEEIQKQQNYEKIFEKILKNV